ncbi:MAG: TonB-dependent receptor plug domain-containing protein, partial [Solirubrobacteraceae bacterium]
MIKKILFVLILNLFATNLYSQKIEVTLFLKDLENQKELGDVQVFVKDSLIGKTNAEGFLTATNIKNGLSKISFIKEGFDKIEEEKDLQNGGFYEYALNKAVAIIEMPLLVKQDSLAPQQPIVVTPPVVVEKKEENTSVFKAKAKYASEAQALTEQRKASEIKEIRSGEELSRKGASNVSKGVEKGAGITNVQGRGIFVRGLEDRYNNLLINGLAVPSNNPFNKIIDLSLIPNDVVGNLEIYKTYNSNLYADFAGATINIETITPQKPVTRISIGASYVTDNNLSKFLMANRQNSTAGFFGLRGNERKLPKSFGKIPNSVTIEGKNAANSFKSGFGVNEINSVNNSSYGIFHAGKISRNLSYLVTSNFDNKYQIREGLERTFFLGGGNYANNLQTTDYSYLTNFSTLAAVNYKLNNRGNLGVNVLYLKSSEALIKDQIGYFDAQVGKPNRFIRTNQYQESSYLNAQLLGDY